MGLILCDHKSAAALFEIRGAAEVTVATTEAPPSFNMYLKLKGLKEAEVSGYTCTGDEVSRVPYDAQPPAEAATSEICGKFAFKTFSMPHKCAHRSLSTWGRHFVYGRFKTGYK